MDRENAADQLRRLILGYRITEAISVVAKLRIADRLESGPQSPVELAGQTATDAGALYRLLRALASVGIFAENADGRFCLTPLAECLRTDAPDSQWPLAMLNADLIGVVWGELLHSIETGEEGFRKTFGMPMFDYLTRNPELGQRFDATMTGFHGAETIPVAEAYDFSAVGTLVDVGGGNGHLITAVLDRHPAMRGVLFDLPDVIERTRTIIGASDVAGRCVLEAGSFFDSVPEGGDAYLLRHIIHDWDDEHSVGILRNCRQALRPEGRVLVVEGIVPAGNEPSRWKWVDLNMLVLLGGKERTEAEYRELLAKAGLEVTRVVPTTAGVSVIESVSVA